MPENPYQSPEQLDEVARIRKRPSPDVAVGVVLVACGSLLLVAGGWGFACWWFGYSIPSRVPWHGSLFTAVGGAAAMAYGLSLVTGRAQL